MLTSRPCVASKTTAMAAAAMQRLIPHSLRHNDSNGEKGSKSRRDDDRMHVDSEQTIRQREDEKQFISHWEDEKRPLNPDEVNQNPEDKRLGHSSRALRVDDFDLVKTLGTGTACRNTLRHGSLSASGC